MAIRPYGFRCIQRVASRQGIDDVEYGMKMVGHDDIYVQFNFAPDIGRPKPFMFNDFSVFIQLHFSVKDLTKEVFAVVGDDGDEIAALRGRRIL